MTKMNKRSFSIKELVDLMEEAKGCNLFGTQVFDKFDLEEIQKEFNGIGPDRMRPKFRKLLTFLGQRYLPAVLIHDLDYAVGGDKKAFHESNERLRKNLNKILRILFSRWNPWYWVEWVSINYIIFAECEYFGWDGFHKSDGEKPEEPTESQD